MNLRIETYLKVTAMNWYRLCSRIVRASNSLHIEKYKSLVSLHQAQWRQNGRTAEISFFQIENLVSSNTQISTKWQFSYFDLHGVSDRTKRQKIFQDLAQSVLAFYYIILLTLHYMVQNFPEIFLDNFETCLSRY